MKNSILVLTALSIGIILPSCVDPYVQTGDRPHTATTYSVGYEVNTLPSGYRTELIDGRNYYNYNGTYYQPRSGRYVVVEAPRTRVETRYAGPGGRQEGVIRELPRGYRPIEHRGTRYYQVNDTYYQQRGSGYIVVGRPY